MAKSFPNTGATVIDSAADLPTASAALEGILMFQKDTNELKICDGSTWKSVIDTDTPPGLVHINTTVLNASSGTNIPNCFSSTYDVYKIHLNGTAGSVNGSNIYFQLSAGGTTSSTGYYYQRLYVQGTTVGGTRTSNNTYAEIGFTSTGVDVGGAITFDLFNPYLAKYTSFIDSMAYIESAPQASIDLHSGAHYVTTSYDGIKILPASGTLTTTVSIYGYRNS